MTEETSETVEQAEVVQTEAEPKAVKFFSDGNFRSSVFGSDSAHI